ncbi:MAG: hypothetical protein ACOCWA_00820, partial [Bacteroidota bacterium]
MLKKFIVLGIGTLLVSLIGLYNGYPLVYSDTGTYISSGFEKFVPWDRPVTYGLFLEFFSVRYSAWFIILIQNLLTAFVIYQVIKLFFSDKKYFNLLYYVITLFLVVLTSVGWYTNQLMPDFFAPLFMLSFFILIMGKKVSLHSQIILSIILLLSLLTHFSHIFIGTLLAILTIALKLGFKTRLEDLAAKRIIVVSSIVFSSWFILPAINYGVEKNFIFSKGSHVFLMAHLNDTGILEKFLDENCSREAFDGNKLCHYKDSLPTDLASFIWSGQILEKTGGWENSAEDYNQIIYSTLKQPEYLLLNLYRSFTYGMIQLTRIDIGEGLTAYNEGSAPYGQIHWRFHDELNNYLNSRQNKWGGANLNFETLNVFHTLLIVLCLFIIILIFSSSLRLVLESRALIFLIFIIIAIT